MKNESFSYTDNSNFVADVAVLLARFPDSTRRNFENGNMDSEIWQILMSKNEHSKKFKK